MPCAPPYWKVVCTMYGCVCMRCAMRETKKVCPEAKSETGSTPALRCRPW